MTNQESIEEIIRLTFHTNGNLIPAIKFYRDFTSRDLLTSKNTIEKGRRRGEIAFRRDLTEEFIQDKRELLRTAELEREGMDRYIERLKEELENENNPVHMPSQSDVLNAMKNAGETKAAVEHLKAKGYSNVAIADVMDISESRVRTLLAQPEEPTLKNEGPITVNVFDNVDVHRDLPTGDRRRSAWNDVT